MNPAETERLRIALLQQLREVAPLALPVSQLATGAALAGFRDCAREVRSEVAYLQDKALVADDLKVLSPELKRYRITAAGRDFLAQEGL